MKKVILGILIGLSLSAISVVALNLCNAKDIEYKASDTMWDVDTVEDALNDLYKNKNNNDSCNNVAEPNLGNEEKLIPVIIDDNGTVTKVNKNNPNWYNYCEKKWANAVILNDNVQAPNDNQEIKMDEIESMFVWIPKYKYRLWNVNVTNSEKLIHSIDIVFDTTNTIEENGLSCVTPMTSGNIGECSNGEYMTHPAFISLDVNGFWAGKFEVGHKTAITTAQAQVSSTDSSLIVVKPNVFSWRNNILRNFFEALYNYESDLNSHMMKNTEWGAIAYLSHSRYGIDHEININNNSAYRTGYSSLPFSHSRDGGAYNSQWNTDIGHSASTTGNITGIYDMSGGAWEYMAAYRSGSYSSGGFTNKSEFEDAYNSKFYDLYVPFGDANVANYMILGDAMGEMGPFKDGITHWYNDRVEFSSSVNSWFDRGTTYFDGDKAGSFCFGVSNGLGRNDVTTRISLSP